MTHRDMADAAERYLIDRGTSLSGMILGGEPVNMADARWGAVMGWADAQVEAALEGTDIP